jgi:hypothetical protein
VSQSITITSTIKLAIKGIVDKTLGRVVACVSIKNELTNSIETLHYHYYPTFHVLALAIAGGYDMILGLQTIRRYKLVDNKIPSFFKDYISDTDESPINGCCLLVVGKA